MKSSELDLAPAPKRGRYDRGLSRRERQAAQRERVIAAIAALSATNQELSVATVVQAAGIGRNTFYEYFDDLEHALRVINTRTLLEFSTAFTTALHGVRTPTERVQALARVWTEKLMESPARVRLALRPQAEQVEPAQLSALARRLVAVLAPEAVLAREQDAARALPGLAEPLRVVAAAAVFDAVSRVHLAEQAMTAQELQRVLTDWSLRLLR